MLHSLFYLTFLTSSAGERPQTYALGRGYIEARTDTTQQSEQTPDKNVEIKNTAVYVSGYNFEFVHPRCVCSPSPAYTKDHTNDSQLR
jgi:hypothetical protein